MDETWMGRYRRWIYAGGYGVQIGAGVATYIMTAAVYGTAALAVLSGPSSALLVGVVFGATRGLAVLVTVPATDPERLRTLLRRVDLAAPASVTALIAVQAVLAAVAAGLAAGPIAAVVVLAVAAVPMLARRRVIVPSA